MSVSLFRVAQLDTFFIRKSVGCAVNVFCSYKLYWSCASTGIDIVTEFFGPSCVIIR